MARILQLTDLHIVKPGTLSSGVLDTCSIFTAAVDRLLRRLPMLGKIDVVVVTGDISDDGSPESYEYAKAELERLRHPVLVVPGNHDSRETMRASLGGMTELPAQGQLDWSVTVEGTKIIGLDTLVEGQGGGRLCSTSLSLLSREVGQAGDQPILVALHHPPIKTGIKFMDAIGLENTPDLAEAVSAAPGEIQFIAGHVHLAQHGRLGRHWVATAPSPVSAFALDVRPDAPAGFMSGPTGCALIETGEARSWTAIPLDDAAGPYPF